MNIETTYRITKEDTTWLKEYIKNPAPSRNEVSGQQMWLDYITPYIDDHIIDLYGNVIGVVNPGQKFKVLIEAHADEIAWYVHTISELHQHRNNSKQRFIDNSKNTSSGIYGQLALAFQ